MRLPRLAVCLFLLAAAAAAAPANAQDAAKKAPPAVDLKARMQEIADAWSTMDPGKVARFYSQDAGNVYYDLAPMKYVGWDAYAKGVLDLFKDFASLKLVVGKDAKATRQGNTAWGTATFHADVVTKDGSKQGLDGRWTFIWQRAGDDWLLVHEHISVPMGPPPPAPAPAPQPGPSRSKKKMPPPPPPPPPRP